MKIVAEGTRNGDRIKITITRDNGEYSVTFSDNVAVVYKDELEDIISDHKLFAGVYEVPIHSDLNMLLSAEEFFGGAPDAVDISGDYQGIPEEDSVPGRIY